MLCQFPIYTGKCLQLVLLVNFHLLHRNVPMLNGGEEGTGQCLHEGRSPEWRHWKIPHESRKAHPNSTTSGEISPQMGNKFITSGEATSDEFSYPWVGIFCHEWWNWDVPWVTNGEFDPSLLRLRWALPFLCSMWKLYIKPILFYQSSTVEDW